MGCRRPIDRPVVLRIWDLPRKPSACLYLFHPGLPAGFQTSHGRVTRTRPQASSYAAISRHPHSDSDRPATSGGLSLTRHVPRKRGIQQTPAAVSFENAVVLDRPLSRAMTTDGDYLRPLVSNVRPAARVRL